MVGIRSGSIFDDIVVAVTFTYPHYNNIDFIRKLYPFSQIVFYGPLLNGDDRVIPCDINNGYFSYRVFLDAFARYNARGIMVVHDDFLLNCDRFEQLDPDKLWSQPWVHDSLDAWSWWRTKYGASAYSLACSALRQSPQNTVHGFSDLMYIPTKMIDKLLPILSIYSSHNVFVELAWPNLVNTFVPASDRQILNTINHVYYEHGHTDWLRLYSRSIHGIHPVKWSDPSNKVTAARLVNGL